MDEIREVFQLLGPRTDSAALVWQMIVRLTLAAFLGGLIGLEREIKHKPAGLRTNMFICFGAALFTILSERLAMTYGGDHTRIAAQIIPGIGFIGAGSIIQARGSVVGLTTAATLFVVASIGMAAGGGLYLVAMFSTLVILLALWLLGWFEGRFNLKAIEMTYDVVGETLDDMLSAINQSLEGEHHTMRAVQIGTTDHTVRMQFSVEAPEREHLKVIEELRRAPGIRAVNSFGAVEKE